MMDGCDTLLMVGTSFPYSEWLPKPGQARGLQIDVDARKLGIRYPVEVAMMGDAAETLRALLPMLQRKEDRAWRREIEEGVERWWRLLAERVLAGDAKMQTTQDLPPFDFAAYARQLGLEGIRVEAPDGVGPAWDRALAADRPVLIDVVTDPEVPPLPPHIRMEHARGFARALLHGDPESGRIARQSLREKVKDLDTR